MKSLQAITIGLIVLIGASVFGFVNQEEQFGAMSVRQTMQEVAVFDEIQATTTSARYDVSSYRHVEFFVSTEDSFEGTIKVKGSNQANVNFGAAQSPTNRWDYVQSKLLDTGATVNGVTGIVFEGTDDHRLYEVNTNYLKNIAFETSAYATGTVSILLSGAND